MRTFKIRVAEDIIIPIRANSVEEARKIAEHKYTLKRLHPCTTNFFLITKLVSLMCKGLDLDWAEQKL